MKRYFVVSLVRGGVLGGGMTADDEKLCYHTGKLTVPDKYRRLPFPYAEITAANTGWLLCFPTVTLTMKSGESYRFVVFARNKLLQIIADKNPACTLPTKWA